MLADLAELKTALTKERRLALEQKRTLNWAEVQHDWDKWFNAFANEEWRNHFSTMIAGLIEDRQDFWVTSMGMGWDRRNIEGESWFQDYILTFAQPINDTTKADVHAILSQAMAEGWAHPQVEKQLDLTWDKYLDPNFTLEGRRLTDQEIKWFHDRSPQYRRELISRTETMRAGNYGSHKLFEDWNVQHKEWLATGDRRTRQSHLAAWADYSEGGRVGPIPMDEAFRVGGFDMMHPHDMDHGAPLKEVANCRCTELPVIADQSVQQQVEEPEEAPPEPVKPPLAPKPGAFPEHFRQLQHVRGLGGSTGAQLMVDPDTGRMYVAKRGASPAHIREEAAADAAYRALGVKVPRFRMYDTDDGPTKVAEFIEGESLTDIMRRGQRRQINNAMKALRKDFGADALMGNWDVMGLDFDNIIVDNDGTAWRIDNGGSFRFRAQGTGKGVDWNEFPEELWTMRDKGRNAQSGEVYGDLAWKDTVRQVYAMNRKRDALLAELPDDLRDTVAKRLDMMVKVGGTSRIMWKDKWDEGYTEELSRHVVGLHKAGVIDALPDKMKNRSGSTRYIVDDERGEAWDNLRGSESAVAELAAYMDQNGGDHSIIQYWAGRQASNSWNGAPQATKWFIAQNRGGNVDDYYWHNGAEKAREHYESATGKLGKEKYDTSFTQWHAYNIEFLGKVNFKHNNQQRNWVELVRTESSSVINRYGLEIGQSKVIQRGACESSSIYNTVVVSGDELTLQRVPHHRIMGVYFHEKRPGSHESLFYGDSENEFMMIPEGIPTHYVGRTTSGRSTSRYWREHGRNVENP
jgi:hypothetical protein